MATIKLERVYVPTLKGPSGPLVVMAGPRPVTLYQTVARPCRMVAERVVKAALDCKRVALQISAVLVTKVKSIAKSLVKYVKKDFLKKEGVPLKGMVIYKGGARGMGRIVKSVS